MMDVRTKERLQGLGVVFSLIASIWAGTTALYGKIEDVTTDIEMQFHDKNDRAHPPIRAEIIDCRMQAERLSRELERERQSSVALGAHMVRLIAADREPNKAIRAAAATYYEQEFNRLIHKGEKIEDALLISLRTPWYTKPR